jgi:hypothetical protein
LKLQGSFSSRLGAAFSNAIVFAIENFQFDKSSDLEKEKKPFGFFDIDPCSKIFKQGLPAKS